MLEVADRIMIGGSMAHTFLAAKGVRLGSSKVEEDKIGTCKRDNKRCRGKRCRAYSSCRSYSCGNCKFNRNGSYSNGIFLKVSVLLTSAPKHLLCSRKNLKDANIFSGTVRSVSLKRNSLLKGA
jgi:hypothetical protein